MAAVIDLPFALPAAPTNYAPAQASSSSVSLTSVEVSPVGDAFLSYMRRRLRQSTFEEDDALVKQRLDEHVAANTQVDELDNDIGEEPESQELLDSDPMQWKSLDHTPYWVCHRVDTKRLTMKSRSRIARRCSSITQTKR